MSSKEIKNVPIEIAGALSLFDEQFSIVDLQNAITKKKTEANMILSSVRRAVINAHTTISDEDEIRYVVDLSGDIKKAISAGEIKLDMNASGEVFAQLRNKNGRYGKKLPIKEELIEQGVSVEAVELALQMDAISDQLKDIIAALSSIEGRVTEVIQGQHNDRLGLFYSGLSLYLESRSLRDESLKKQIIAQALRSINDASAQMIQELRTSVKFLVTEQYLKARNITDKIEEQLSVIYQCYDIIYRAAFLKAIIYQENGEISAMLTAIDEYGRFVEKMIVPYAGKLSELDRKNRFIEKGTWGAICHTLVRCRDLKDQITQRHTYYISSTEDRDGIR